MPGALARNPLHYEAVSRLASFLLSCRPLLCPIIPFLVLSHARAETADFGVKLQPFRAQPETTRPVPRAKLIASPAHIAYYRAEPVTSIPHAEPADSASKPEIARTVTQMSGPTVAGDHAVLRRGIAYAPAKAPANVKNAIWSVNTLCRKPYRWGGGHSSFQDYGYDCSGTVSYALHSAGVLATPMPSSDFVRYGERGRGRWITVYARRGHTFAVIAGLRLDTTDMRSGGDVGPRWYVDGRDARDFEVRHPAGW